MGHVPVRKLSSNSLSIYPSMIHILLVVSPWFSITISRFNKDSPTLTIIHQHEPLFTNIFINHLTMIHHLTMNHHIPLSPEIHHSSAERSMVNLPGRAAWWGATLPPSFSAVAISWVSLRWCHGDFFTISWGIFMEN